MRIKTGAAFAAGAFATIAAGAAHAGGFEYPENGSEAMGRGGAFVARASDPSAIMLNTAGMVGLDGLQISVGSNVAFLHNCFTRGSTTDGSIPGVYQGFAQNTTIMAQGTPFADPSDPTNVPPYASGTVPYPQVCNSAGAFPAPQLLATYRINRFLAIGVGVYGPNSVGRQEFPLSVTTTDPATNMSVMAPGPERYMLLSEDLLIIHPTLAVAVAPVRWLRFGLALQPSFAQFKVSTMANAVSSQSPATDIRTDINASGWFPAFNASAQLVAPRYFSVGAHFHYNPDTVNLSGTGQATDTPYAQMPPSASSCNEAHASCFTVTQMQVHLPWSLKFGWRFAMPRAGSVAQNDPHYDPMRDDVFDFEMDWNYEHSSAFSNLSLMNSGSITIGTVNSPVPNASVPHNWHDVWGLRVGGDFNVMPNLLALRIGVSYEMGAQSITQAQLDVPSYTTLGLHAGFSVRLSFLTISAAYAHFFMDDITVISSPGNNVTMVGMTGALTPGDCGATNSDACGVNVGRYQASMDVFNLGLTAHF